MAEETLFTQVGYGPGASLIFSCLQELHRRELGHLVYSATLISLPEAPSAVAWASARSVVAHEVVNVYSNSDWVLAIAARLFTLSNKIAGLGPVTVEGVTNVDVSDLVHGHLEIRSKLAEILDRVEQQRRKSGAPAAAAAGAVGAADESKPTSTHNVDAARAKPDADELSGIERARDDMTTVEMRGSAGNGDSLDASPSTRTQ
ncbi:hypothetical protein JCM11491_006860 [Sporobolomyces phaffii]